MSDKTKATQTTVDNHLRAFFRRSIDGVLEDYADDAVLVIPTGPLYGVAAIRGFFTAFIETMPAGFLDAFKMRRQDFVGELGYILWDAEPWVHFATDTFVVREGKIVEQTFAAYPASW
jgi:ketosteroid isomerase-like protein